MLMRSMVVLFTVMFIVIFGAIPASLALAYFDWISFGTSDKVLSAFVADPAITAVVLLSVFTGLSFSISWASE